ncbi:purine-binding chemotaxis protein CheW [Alkalibacillus filiformis]|uniref:Purine-binding chemotaxis protein CheW n=1 Tax=Alkalibacillus filiformis TaxID=200990 RepID=A0ABU0DQC3_9BACI|nr:chemotaxis protein CheW [Alkalibacillus filiformis]MDQ0350643.1 purine-binding chemotaxis protein CheW [Alkalibacillus filiformis]
MSEVIQNEKVIVFQLKDEEYGVPIEHVGSIERMQGITRVPRAPRFVKGVMNLRGVITPIIDLRERFNLEQEEYTESTRIIIVTIGDQSVGMIVDAANDVVDVPQNQIEPSPEVVGSVSADYIKGVAKIGQRLLVLLNLDKVLSEEEFDHLSKVKS